MHESFSDCVRHVERGATQTDEANVIQLVQQAAPPKLLQVETPSLIDWPPGQLGKLAKWFYDMSPRPVREVSIVAAMGVAAGIFGRAYNISNSGLNLYIVLVARSAIGKEAMHSSISKLSHVMMSSGATAFSEFVDFSDYASGPALVKAISNSKTGSFVNVAGEWGRKLRKMGDDNTDGPMSSLRTVMTNLYQKSSAGTIVGGIGYSDKEKNIAATQGVAYSMIGETTPDTFYESLTNTMMQDGFMSRFIVVEYAGLRPELNADNSVEIPRDLYNSLHDGVECVMQRQAGVVRDVALDIDAQIMLDEFDKHCDEQINATDDEAWRQMWNRAHLKSLKVAGLLAVTDCPLRPCVTKKHAKWALNLIHRDISIMRRKMCDGDVGSGDVARERKMLSVLSNYLQHPVAAGYKISDEMRRAGVVARKYLQIRLQRTNSFLRHRLGQTIALDNTIRSLIDSGYLVEVTKDKIPKTWGAVGKVYRIVSLPEIF